jgi:CheY-like chemotaxis protein
MSPSLAATPVAATPIAGPTGRRALIVDDEHAVRLVLRRWLERRGWEVDDAGDGREALAMLEPSDVDRLRCYDLVICDLRMPRLNGPDLHRWIRENRPDVLANLVFSSGDVFQEEAARFLQENGCRVLEKPFELTRLAHLIEAVRVAA